MIDDYEQVVCELNEVNQGLLLHSYILVKNDILFYLTLLSSFYQLNLEFDQIHASIHIKIFSKASKYA